MDSEQYQSLVDEMKPQNKVLKNTIRAFIVGGLICLSAEIIKSILLKYNIEKEMAQNIVTLIYIFLGVFLTGIGVYEKIGKFAGAGSIVPISGFANSVAAPAIEFKKEGFIAGVATRIFTVSGPVILYGSFASIVCGIVYYLIKR